MREGWTETTLSDVAEVNMGQSPPGHTYNTEGVGMPFMQGSAEFGEHFPEPVKFCSAPAKIAEVGDLLLSVRAPVGDTNFANQRIAIGRGLATVRASAVSLTEFLRLVIQLNTAGLLATSGTGMFSSITGKNLKEFMILLPPIDEQKRIVDVVSSVDAYIDALQQQVDAARTARNAVLHELLTAGGNDWTETTLGEVLSIQSGFAFSTNDWADDGYPVIKINNVRDGKVSTESCSYIADPIPKGAEKFQLSCGDLLITLTGEIGATGTVHQDFPMYLNQRVGKITVKDGSRVLLNYLAVHFNYQPVRDEMWSLGKGNAQLNISPKSIHEMQVNLPPIAEQRRIVEIVSSMDGVIQAAERAVVEAKNLRSGLLSDLLSGEHEIPVSYDELLGAA
jgi:type I restriction enzyme S subunit